MFAADANAVLEGASLQQDGFHSLSVSNGKVLTSLCQEHVFLHKQNKDDKFKDSRL